MTSKESTSQKNNEKTIITDLSSHKFNLFQQFYVIGLDPKICYNLYKIDLKHLPKELLSPRIISKFPNISLPYLNIPDSFIASHCFPKGLLNKIIYYKDEEFLEKSKYIEEWVFSLDNLAVQDFSSSLRINKVYFNCLLFYEKFENFKNLSNYRRKMSFKSKEKLEEEINKNVLIPKVICLSSFTPLFSKAGQILWLIKRYCDKFNFEALFYKDNFCPIENIIQEIIYGLPGLPRGNFSLRFDCSILIEDIDFSKSNKRISIVNNKLTNKKIEMIFEEYPINKNPKALINYSLLMTFFTVEELFDIIRSIILEEPILFFCDDIYNLTYTIEGIISLIYPLYYPYPVVAVLPEENFSLINVFYHFIFGINYKYSEDLWREKFEYLGDKQKIVIIPIETRFPNFMKDIDKEKNNNTSIITKSTNTQMPLVQLSSLTYYKKNNKKENSDKSNETKKNKIKLPIHYSSKCIKRLEPIILSKMKEEKAKKKEELTPKEKDQICNREITDNFLYFFTCILLNYQEYINVKFEKIKIPNIKNNPETSQNKENIIYKRPEDIEYKYINDELKINDMFNTSGFIDSTPTLDRPFYEKFFKTKIFYNFIKKKLFPISVMDKLEILFFDDKVNEKLSREMKLKKIETKFLETKLETISGEISIETSKKEISVETKEFFENYHNCEKGLNYFQYIIKDINESNRLTPPRNLSSEDDINHEGNINNIQEEKLEKFKFYYFVFPKLLNDGIFFHNKEKKSKEENNYIRQNSSCFYTLFEKEGMKIVNNPIMTSNYKNHSYSLNPKKWQVPEYVNYLNFINKLWLQMLAKTFYCIQNNKKSYYFYQIIQFLNQNEKAIDDNTLIILFNTFNKYGDKNMNQEFFVNFSRRKKTYTSFLFLKEKVKNFNIYIDYYSLAGKNFKIEDKFLFIVNKFCTKIEEKQDKENKNIYNICGEQTLMEISSMFNEEDKYISFECNKELNKKPKKQALIISCFYEKGEGLRYQINFRLVSPSFILKQNWFTNTDTINIDLMRKEYLDIYLSAIFYFHQQGLIFDFLLPKSNQIKDLFIDNIYKDINFVNKEINKEEKKENNILEINDKEEEKKEDKKKKLLMSTNIGLDLGGLDIEFNESPVDMKKKSKSPKKNYEKKKTSKTITVDEFKLNIEDIK